MGKYSRIQDQKNLSFQWKSGPAQAPDTVFSVDEVISTINSGGNVSVKGKVLFKSQIETWEMQG